MIIRVTQKLGQKIHVVPEGVLPVDPNPFADWSASVFVIARTQYILLTNTATLYSALMYGKGITSGSNFVQQAVHSIGEVLKTADHEFFFSRLVLPSTGSVSFSKALNQSVTGSMNDFRVHVEGYIYFSTASLLDMSLRLNRLPVRSLKYANPDETLLKCRPYQTA